MSDSKGKVFLNETRSVPTLALEFAKFLNDAERECLDAGERPYDVAMKVAKQFDLSIIEFAIANKTTKIYAVNQVVENRDFPNKILAGSNYVFYSENEFESAKQAANNFKANIIIYDLRRILMLSDEDFEHLSIGYPNKDMARKYRKLMNSTKKNRCRFESTPPNRDNNFNIWEKLI